MVERTSDELRAEIDLLTARYDAGYRTYLNPDGLLAWGIPQTRKVNQVKDTFTIMVKREVTVENLKDVLCTAFEGGSNYWIGEVRLCGWTHVGTNDYRSECKDGGRAEYIHEIPAVGGVLQIRNLEEKDWHTLTRDKLLAGITHAANEGRINLGDEDWTTNVDAEIADVILQYALLGEIRYG